MRNNETGEFELVVGNRQLLSAFFIVVLLFAVSFAMGYVVGQNTQHTAKATESPSSPLTAPTAADRPQPLAPVASTTAPTGATTGEQTPSDPNAPPQPTTQPALPATPPAVEQEPAGTPPAAGTATADLPPGSFWQVMAVRQPTAEAAQQSLKNKGFPVVLTPGANNLIRVLVGPYADNTALGRAKTELEEAGMHPLRFKREQ